jgi:phosphatidylserine/phosphatidylglycerophosphate/cardiolipin synthase-like enzyme
MRALSPSYKRYLENRQNEQDAQKYRESRALDLYDEKSFYRAFVRDLLEAKKEVVIYCPFISKYRSEFFRRTLEKLKYRNIAVFIFTRPLEEHEYLTRSEIKAALADYEELGTCIIHLPGYIHAKAAIIDREVLWDGSLNILSQRESKEIMRRTVDTDIAKQMLDQLGLNRKLAEGYKYQYERLYRNLVEKRRLRFAIPAKLKNLAFGIPKFFSRLLSVISRSFVLLLRCIKLVVGLLT